MAEPEQLLARARALLDKFKLHDWQVAFADLSRVPTRTLVGASSGAQGICVFHSKRILLDPSLIPHRNECLSVVRHEIAHALLGRMGHGVDWLAIAKRVGCSKRSLSVYRMMAKADEFKKTVSQ